MPLGKAVCFLYGCLASLRLSPSGWQLPRLTQSDEASGRMRCFSTGQEELCCLAHALHGPQESPGAGKAFRGWQERGEWIRDVGLALYFPSEVVGLEVHRRNTCLWVFKIQGPCARRPPASQPSTLPQRGRNEGTVACTYCQVYPELSIGLVHMGTSSGKHAK